MHGSRDTHSFSRPVQPAAQVRAGRLWDVVWMLRFAIIRSQPARLTKLIANAGAVDIDDPSPAITVMLPEED